MSLLISSKPQPQPQLVVRVSWWRGARAQKEKARGWIGRLDVAMPRACARVCVCVRLRVRPLWPDAWATRVGREMLLRAAPGRLAEAQGREERADVANVSAAGGAGTGTAGTAGTWSWWIRLIHSVAWLCAVVDVLLDALLSGVAMCVTGAVPHSALDAAPFPKFYLFW